MPAFVERIEHDGGTLALSTGVPLLSAGKLEGKNDVNARLAFAGVGLDLGSE